MINAAKGCTMIACLTKLTSAESTRLRRFEENDSLSEMGKMEVLRLQIIMERRSKADATISNIMKKSSDTLRAIVENLK